ncbi:MAG: alpha/beta fold hydrolase [Gemmatimonadaceae bacterium]
MLPGRPLSLALLIASTIAMSCLTREDSTTSSSDRRQIDFSELEAPPVPPPGEHISYGIEPFQFGELRLPKGRGPFPLAVIIHGGCWLKQYDLKHAAREATALTKAGIATWTIEYRRADDFGGGWPGTFDDVAHATDYVTQLATRYPLNLKRVVLVGHSAGGQLALWLASRARHAPAAPNPDSSPLAVRGVVSLAGITDLRTFGSRSGRCSAAVSTLLGGSADDQPARYDAVSPVELLPLGVPIRLVHGTADNSVPVEQSLDFAARAKVAGDNVKSSIIPDAGHFDFLEPRTTAWPAVIRAVRELVGTR